MSSHPLVLSAQDVDLVLIDDATPTDGPVIDWLRRAQGAGVAVGAVAGRTDASADGWSPDYLGPDRAAVLLEASATADRTVLVANDTDVDGSGDFLATLSPSKLSDGKSAPQILGLPSALDHLDELTQRLRRGRIAVGLDYDGTLTPIVPHPADAVLSAEMRELLHDLAALCPVAVVSGRDLDSLRELAGLDVDHIAEHGMVIEVDAQPVELHPQALAIQPDIDRVERQLRDDLSGIAGVLIERKQLAVAVHYRQVADADVAIVDRKVSAALSQYPALRLVRGKKVHEFRPDIEWDKGRAVLQWARERAVAVEGIVFIGDDRTDEDVFRVIRRLGVGVVVLPSLRPTDAGYFLRDPEEVGTYLRRIIDVLRPPSA